MIQRGFLIYIFDLLVISVAGCAENVSHFVHNHFFNRCSARAHVFSGVEFFGVLNEEFADSRSHSQSQVCVDVDFSYAVF